MDAEREQGVGARGTCLMYFLLLRGSTSRSFQMTKFEVDGSKIRTRREISWGRGRSDDPSTSLRDGSHSSTSRLPNMSQSPRSLDF